MSKIVSYLFGRFHSLLEEPLFPSEVWQWHQIIFKFWIPPLGNEHLVAALNLLSAFQNEVVLFGVMPAIFKISFAMILLALFLN